MSQVYPADELNREKGIAALVTDPNKMPEAVVRIEAGRPNDRLMHLRR